MPLGIELSDFHDGALAGWLTDLLEADWDSLSKDPKRKEINTRQQKLDIFVILKSRK